MYFVVPDRARKGVKAICMNHARDVGVMYKYLDTHAPFDRGSIRRDLTHRLNEIAGISMPIERADRRAFDVKLEVLRNPKNRAAFFAVFDDVASFLAGPSALGSRTCPSWSRRIGGGGPVGTVWAASSANTA